MAEVTKPSSPGWARVSPRYIKVKPRNVSPFTLTSQAYVWSGETWRFTFELPPIVDQTVAQAWRTFLRDLAKDGNYFVCNVAAYTPTDVGTVSGEARNLNLRLVDPQAAWEVGRGKVHQFTFECEIDQ